MNGALSSGIEKETKKGWRTIRGIVPGSLGQGVLSSGSFCFLSYLVFHEVDAQAAKRRVLLGPCLLGTLPLTAFKHAVFPFYCTCKRYLGARH